MTSGEMRVFICAASIGVFDLSRTIAEIVLSHHLDCAPLRFRALMQVKLAIDEKYVTLMTRKRAKIRCKHRNPLRLLPKTRGRSCRAAKQPPLRVGIDARSAGIKKWWLVSASEEHPRPRVHNFAAHTVKVWTAPSRWSGVPKLRTRSPRTFALRA